MNASAASCSRSWLPSERRALCLALKPACLVLIIGVALLVIGIVFQIMPKRTGLAEYGQIKPTYRLISYCHSGEEQPAPATP
jgi:hypothetical protein